MTETLEITTDQLAHFRYISKIFERCIFHQLSNFTDQFFSKCQCDCLLAMLEILKSAMYKGKSFSALLIDLSKAFNCLPYELLLAKLRAYGFSIGALRVIHSYSKK